MELPPSQVLLLIRGCGHIPSFKNKKRMGKSSSGQPVLYTRSDVKRLMDSIILSLESQLRSACRTSALVTSMGQPALSWIVSSLPLDDSWQFIPELVVRVEQVERGQEGADIVVERL